MIIINTKDKIVGAADELFYQRGFNYTSFADIAKAVNISRGNFYYHFKSKDQILNAVIDLRRSQTHQLLTQWDSVHELPLQRLFSFINNTLNNSPDILQYGCPTTTLNTELLKMDHPAAADTKIIFMLYRTWLRRQFKTMGHKSKADDLAMHLLTQTQGIIIQAGIFNDLDFLTDEANQLKQWLEQLVAE